MWRWVGPFNARDLGAPFCALHRLADGPIVSAHHYLSDPDLLARLGRFS